MIIKKVSFWYIGIFVSFRWSQVVRLKENRVETNVKMKNPRVGEKESLSVSETQETLLIEFGAIVQNLRSTNRWIFQRPRDYTSDQ